MKLLPYVAIRCGISTYMRAVRAPSGRYVAIVKLSSIPSRAMNTIAPRPEARRFRELRATLETAYHRLHQRMHAAGVYHHHPLHDPAQPHEH